MAHIHHNTETIHLSYHLLTKLAYAIVRGTTFCTVADVVVSVVAERDIHYAASGKVFYVGNVAFKGKAVLNA